MIAGAVRQPVTVGVGVVLVLLAGFIALRRIPIQLTPNVEDTIVAVTTRWEGASPEEIEREIVDEQEEYLQGLANLRLMTSESAQGRGVIRLEFAVGTDKDVALREVSDKLREVPSYPDNVDEPVIEASDPENRDFIAWMLLATDDPTFDIRTLQDFAEDRIEPRLERIPGMAEVNVLGGRAREAQIRFDPARLASFGLAPSDVAAAVQRANRNVSAGEVADAKSDVRLRTIGQFERVEDALEITVAETDRGAVYLRDVAEVVETYKESDAFVRSRGRPVIAINAQREVGTNVMEIMAALKGVLAELNDPGGVLAEEAKSRDLDGGLRLELVYDQTVYIDDALALVRNNIWLGGGLAIIVLLLFLRSIRSVGIIALAIPISVVGAVVAMVAMGRTVNVVSLAGMAFAVGLVVDNAIVVLENIFRHLEMGKRPAAAALDGAREVWGAVLAATLTTVAVFVPILLVKEEAGQLFRDIALAICAAVLLSLVVSVTVIPAASARILRPHRPHDPAHGRIARMLHALGVALHALPDRIGRLVYALAGGTWTRLGVVGGLTLASVVGTWVLMPPADYLPTGNRNIVFGLLIPPPGYNVAQELALARRIEGTLRPFWEAAALEPGTAARAQAMEALPRVPIPANQGGGTVVPPPIVNYFFVARDGALFHGALSEDPQRVADLRPLFAYATRDELTPGVFAFAFQLPLFRLGGTTGSAIKVNLVGDDLDRVTDAAGGLFMLLMQRFGPGTVQPSPSNFNIYGPEIQVRPIRRRLAEVGLSPEALALSVAASGDGALIGEYRLGSDTVDLRLIAADAVDQASMGRLEDLPIATPAGGTVPLGSIARIVRTTSPPQINHVGRQRSVTLQVTPPPGMPLEAAKAEVAAALGAMREGGSMPTGVVADVAGSASKLDAVRSALLGDGTVVGTLESSLVLALLVVYLLMCVLFQSLVQPLVIMFSVPLATLGGFAALAIVHAWSAADRYLPVQNLDVLTMLGFVILIGIVVNNAILIVHQTRNFMAGTADDGGAAATPMPPRRAIAEAVRTRVRPIFMSTFTSVGGMLPLVLMPGSGSELYRGLGSVVVGGLLVSTIFTVLLVPLLLSLVLDAETALRGRRAVRPAPAAAGAPAGATRRP